MTRVLILSSWVAEGHVGLSAATPVLQGLGHAVTQLPTVMLSNHKGWPHVAGQAIPTDQLAAMIDALRANGWLEGLDAVLTGYLPTPAHVALAADLIGTLRTTSPGLSVVVDPVLGDAPKGLYVPRDVAEAVRDRLAPLADILTPNAFELGWLSGAPTSTLQEAARAIDAYSRPGQTVLMTSALAGPGRIGVLQGGASAPTLWATPERNGVPNGVGDVFAALIAAGLPVGAALGHLNALIDASLDASHLKIAQTHDIWRRATPLPPVPIEDT